VTSGFSESEAHDTAPDWNHVDPATNVTFMLRTHLFVRVGPTETDRRPPRGERPRRRGRVLGGVVTVASALAVSLVGGDMSPVSAAGATVVPATVRSIDPIADSATRALALLRRDLARGEALSAAYLAARAGLADEVGARLWTPGEQFDEAWGQADHEHQVAVLGALTQLGIPYKRNASLPGVGFDCSGLTSFAWSVAGFRLPRNSTAQIRAAEPRTWDTAQAGDLVRYPGHVMMWLGVGKAVIHSPQSGRHVEIKFIANHRFTRSSVGDPTQ